MSPDHYVAQALVQSVNPKGTVIIHHIIVIGLLHDPLSHKITRVDLFKICRNKALNHLKKYQRMVGLSPEAEEFIEDESEEIEARMELKDSRLMLHRALQKLPQNYREVLYLRYFADLSMRDAAKVMRITEKQAAAIAYQARQQLKKILEKEGYSGEEL